jgi:hypothetical protein
MAALARKDCREAVFLFLKKASCALALWPAEKLDQSEEPEGSGGNESY